MSTLNIRNAVEADVEIIMSFIKALAEYEHLESEVTATEEVILESLFVKKAAEVLIAEYDESPVGFALYFQNFSTFTGKPGIYLEDLFVLKDYRNFKIGKALLSRIAQIAIERDCGRFEWACLDWNEPSIKFYKHMGAVPMSDWTVYRITGETLSNVAKGIL